ncbi:MAG: nucleotide exchange factor GrpE [Anaerolineae bacterium]
MTKKKIKVKTNDSERDESSTVEEEIEEQEQLEGELDELEKLEAELEEARAQAAEYLDGWQRAQAEFSNYRKRQEAERGQMMALANTAVLHKILPVVDDFERAMATMPDDLRRLTWCEGISLIKAKLDALLDSEGVKPIEAEGKEFDPVYHEAVTYEEAPGYEEGQIIGEVQRGYMLGERVLRPAMVRVAKASTASSAESKDTIEDKEE